MAVLLVFLRLTACVTFFAFYFTVPLLFKASRELKLPTKQGESWKEGDKPGEEKREALTLETYLDSPSLRRKFVEMEGERHECLLTDVLRCCYFTEGFTQAKQNATIPHFQHSFSQAHHIPLFVSICHKQFVMVCVHQHLLISCYFCAFMCLFCQVIARGFVHTDPFMCILIFTK